MRRLAGFGLVVSLGLAILAHPDASAQQISANVVDTRLEINARFEYRDEGSLVEFDVVATNIGLVDVGIQRLLLRVSDRMEVLNTDKECDQYLSNDFLDTVNDVASVGLICDVGPLAAGESYEMTLTARSASEAPTDTLHVIEGEIEVIGQVDGEPANNSAVGSVLGSTGNYSAYEVQFDTIFVNEASGQFTLPLLRSGSSDLRALIAGNFHFDTADELDIKTDFGALSIEYQPGNFGLGRAVVEVEAEDAAEGTEAALVRLSTFNPTSIDVDIVIRDDLTGISSAGAEPLAAVLSPYASVQTLDLASESIAGVSDDFNGDGFIDIAFVEGDRGTERGFFLEIYTGSASGFADQPAVQIPRSARATDLASGDFNNDGQVDLIVADVNGLQVFIDDGMGGLIEGQHLPGPIRHQLAVADLDRNGTDDVVAIRPGNRAEQNYVTTRIYLQDSTGFLSLSQEIVVPNSIEPDVVVADINNDGKLDIMTNGDGFQSDVNILLQKPDNRYGAPLLKFLAGPNGEFGYPDIVGITNGDIDNDGVDELLTLGDAAIINGSGDGIANSVEPIRSRHRLISYKTHDMNDDGLLDLISNAGFEKRQLPAIYFQLPEYGFKLMPPPSYSDARLREADFQEPWIVADLDDDGSPDVVTIGVSEDHYYGQVQAFIGYNWPKTESISAEIRSATGALAQGASGSMIVRVSNRSGLTSGESTLALASTRNIRINDAYAAAGTCGLLKSDRSNAGCMLPRLAPSGYVDVRVSYEAISSGAASITASAQGRTTDANSADNSVVHDFDVSSPAAPPPKKKGGGGGSFDAVLLWLALSVIALARRSEAPRRRG